MKRWVSIAAAVVAVVSVVPVAPTGAQEAPTQAPAPPRTPPEPPAAAEAPRPAPPAPEDSFVVVLGSPDDVPGQSRALAAAHGGRAARHFQHVLGGFEFRGPAAAAARLAREPGVRAVVPNRIVELADVAGYGFFRIGADRSVAHADGPYRGAGTRLAVIDSGADLDHPDLVPNLDLANGYDCVAPGTTPEDDNGHGTHVAGTAAAAFNSPASGVVGIAPDADIVPLKAFDASGFGQTTWILCALDRLALATAGDPMPTVINMSFEETTDIQAELDGSCDDGIATDVLHEAICDVVEAGRAAGVPVVPVAAAGNRDADASTGVPAAFDDVLTVSALADHDGARGGTAGCQYVVLLFNYECDDTIASFSNVGLDVDLIAPGVDIYSTVPGGHDHLSGTSMAAPHVSGVVALVLAEHAGLDTGGVRSLLLRTGECPDGSPAGADESCAGQGGWQKTENRSLLDPTETGPDPDGVPEPLVSAVRAAAEADAMTPDAPPPVVQPVGGAVTEGDTGTTTLLVQVDLSHASTSTVSVQWETVDTLDQPRAGVDYDAAAGTLTFAPGQVTKTIPITVHGDTLDEGTTFGAEWGAVRFHSPVNATVGTGFGQYAFALIVDDDPPPTILPRYGSALEGDSGTTTIDVRIELSAPSGKTVTVDWATIDTLAEPQAGVDHQPASGTLTFAPGDTAKTVLFTVIGDTVDEPGTLYGAEWGAVALSNPTNATFGTGFLAATALALIVDDD